MIKERTSGVYEIVNIVNGHRYIGSSMEMDRRWRRHKNYLNKSIHHCLHLQNSWNKHGENVFIFRILLLCENFELLRYEQFFLDTYKPEYNKAIFAGSPTRGMKMSNETKAKMSKALLGNKRTLGRIRPKEELDQISKKLKGRIIHQNTIEASIRSHVKYWGSFSSPSGIVYDNILNLASFCREHQLDATNMRSVFLGTRKQHKGWTKC